MRETSIEIYNKIRESGMLSNTRFKIFEAICRRPRTANEIFWDLGMQTNQSGRFTELQEMDVIEESGTRICSITGNRATVWEVTGRMPKKTKVMDKKLQTILNSIAKVGKEIDESLKPRLRQAYIEVEEVMRSLEG